MSGGKLATAQMVNTMNQKKQKGNVLLLIGISLIWFLIGWFVRGFFRTPQDLSIDRTLNLIQEEGLYQTDSDQNLRYDAIRGLLISLADPHAALIAPPVSSRFEIDFAGESGVIGMVHGFADGDVVITHIFEGDPAAKAGLRVDDKIISVDDLTITPLTSLTEISYMIRGPVGEPVHLVIKREGERLTFDPIRQKRTIVQAEMLTETIGLITQYTFTTNADELFQQALIDLTQQGAEGIIWDLRSNGGGSVQTAQRILSMLIEDEILYQVEFPDQSREIFYPVDDIEASDIPIVILIGEHTYSAAEMSAAAIQDGSRGLLIGGTSFGKGTIQNTNEISEGVLLQLSIAKWLSPQGTWYEGEGVQPDIFIKDQPETSKDEILEKAIDILTQE
jgi:carboxyl-terminal processing protease